MNAPRRHNRPEPIYPASNPKGGSPKTGAINVTKKVDQFGEGLSRKRWGDKGSMRKKMGK